MHRRVDMSIEYLGLSEINGPLIVLEGVKNAFFEEMVEFVVEGGKRKLSPWTRIRR